MLPTHEILSGISGSVSLTCWLFVLVPQLYENYSSKSADGISLAFLIVWFIGDLANLLGATLAGLVPTVIALALYFCFADVVLIAQILFYNYLNFRKKGLQPTPLETEDRVEQPLLSRRSSDIGIPGSTRRFSASSKRQGAAAVAVIPEDGSRSWLKNSLSVFAVCALGIVGFYVAFTTGLWKPTIEDSEIVTHESVPAQILGYISALLYLGARIPQITKNSRERSCEGLSILFFMLSLLGNLSYGGGILFHSLEKEYLLVNLPWLIGSLGTIAEDLTIFIQFHLYGNIEVERQPAIERDRH